MGGALHEYSVKQILIADFSPVKHGEVEQTMQIYQLSQNSKQPVSEKAVNKKKCRCTEIMK